MKLSISNIAWPDKRSDEVFKYLAGTRVSAIEMAPSRVWSDYRIIDKDERKFFSRKVRNYGLSICSMHSLYYGQMNMRIVGNLDEKKRFNEFTRSLIELAGDLEIPKMVLGSPSVRDKGKMSFDEALECSASVLRPLGDYAYSCGTKLLIEALSKEDSNFINTHEEAIGLVDRVNSEGFGLHLDAKAISAEKVDYGTIFDDCKGRIEHFHINEPRLGGFERSVLNHEEMSECLRKDGYDGFVSIEMRQLDDYMGSIKTAVEFAEKVYQIA